MQKNTVPELCIGVLVIHQKKVLLLKSPKWHGRYVLPCGHVEFGETVLDAVKREVKEETGLVISDILFLKVDELIHSAEFKDAYRHFVCLQYVAKADSDKITLNHEAQSHIWVSPCAALNLRLDSVTKRTITEYLRSIN